MNGVKISELQVGESATNIMPSDWAALMVGGAKIGIVGPAVGKPDDYLDGWVQSITTVGPAGEVPHGIVVWVGDSPIKITPVFIDASTGRSMRDTDVTVTPIAWPA